MSSFFCPWTNYFVLVLFQQICEVQRSVLLCIFSSPAILSLKRSCCQCLSLSLSLFSNAETVIRLGVNDRLLEVVQRSETLCRDRLQSYSPNMNSQAEPLVMNAKDDSLDHCSSATAKHCILRQWRNDVLYTLSLASDAHCMKICCLLSVHHESFRFFIIHSRNSNSMSYLGIYAQKQMYRSNAWYSTV